MNGGDAVTLTRLAPDSRIRILIDQAEPPPATPEVLRCWDRMKRAIPRLYNAPLLSVTGIDAAQGIIHCRRDTYQRLVVQPQVECGVEQLSVTGILIAGKRIGHEECLLIGRRSSQTRMYAGMWELGPAGGVEAPEAAVQELDHDALMHELVREVREEANLDIAGCPARAIGIVYDPVARSFDVAIEVELCDIPRSLDTRARAKRTHDVGDSTPSVEVPTLVTPHGWEYERVDWLPKGSIAQVLDQRGDEFIAPTRVLLTALAEDADGGGADKG